MEFFARDGVESGVGVFWGIFGVIGAGASAGGAGLRALRPFQDAVILSSRLRL